MKTFFLSRLFREKVLLLGLVFVAAFLWLLSMLGRATTFVSDYKNTSATLERQQVMLDAADSVRARSEAALHRLDSSRTFDVVRLQAELDTIATTAGIANKTISDSRTDKTSQFSVNSAQIQLRNTDYASLVKFYEELKKRSPYIGIDSFTITPNAANPAQLTIAIKVSSVEIVR